MEVENVGNALIQVIRLKHPGITPMNDWSRLSAQPIDASEIPIIDEVSKGDSRPIMTVPSMIRERWKRRSQRSFTNFLRLPVNCGYSSRRFRCLFGIWSEHYEVSESARSLNRLIPSPLHALPCMQASVVGSVEASLSSSVRVFMVCEK